jgi:glucose-1-phosphate thymidylyltransferase
MVAVLPAAGRARRLGRLPCSKEILPIPDRATDTPRLTTGIETALAAARTAGAAEAAVILSPGKQDIPAYLGDGERLGISLTFLEAADSKNSPDTVSRAAGWAGSRDMLLLFPDILWEPLGALGQLETLRRGGAEAALMLVPSDRGDKVDIVSVEPDGRVLDLAMKPGPNHAGLTWTCARWSSRFTRFLCQNLSQFGDRLEGEMHIGHVVACAIRSGFDIRGAVAAEGRALDIGTTDDFFRAWGLPNATKGALGGGLSGLS